MDKIERLEGRKRKLHFSAHKDLTDCGLGADSGLGNRSASFSHGVEGSHRVPRRSGIPTSPPHKQHSPEGGPGSSKEEHTSLMTEG